MAIVSLLLGGVLGFLGAALAFVGLEVSPLWALGIWWGLGSFCAVTLFAFALLMQSVAETNTAKKTRANAIFS